MNFFKPKNIFGKQDKLKQDQLNSDKNLNP